MLAALATGAILTLSVRDALVDGEDGSPGGTAITMIAAPIVILALAAIMGAAAYGICALAVELWFRLRERARQ